MATNIFANGRDLEEVLAPRTGVDKAPDTHIMANGVDISELFQPMELEQELPPTELPGIKFTDDPITSVFAGQIDEFTVFNIINDSYTGSWKNRLLLKVDFKFNSATEAEEFMKYGGRINISMTYTPDVSTAKNIDWSDMVSSFGTFSVGHTKTYFGGTEYSLFGVYGPTDEFRIIYVVDGTNAYDDNHIWVKNYLLASDPTTIRLEVEFHDDAANVDEYVTGAFTCIVDLRKHPTQPSPTISYLTRLNDGN